MTKPEPSWSVVATVDEPPALLQAFVAWHLALGAHDITLYFDRPDDPAAAIFADLPQVIVRRCDDAYWKTGKGRPEKHQIRQYRNATDAYRTCQADWLLHIDADEFLWSEQTISATLGAVRPAEDTVILPVAERIYPEGQPAPSVFSGLFRRPFRGTPDKGVAVFGDAFRLTSRGLTGHTNGKAFARTGREMEVSIHRPKYIGAMKGQELLKARPEAITLLHFDGLTPLHWIYKLLRKADAIANHNGMPASAHRQLLIEEILRDVPRVFDLHDRIKGADAARRQILRRRNLLVRAEFDPQEAIATYFPDRPADLRAATFDAWLRTEKAHIFELFGLT